MKVLYSLLQVSDMLRVKWYFSSTLEQFWPLCSSQYHLRLIRLSAEIEPRFAQLQGQCLWHSCVYHSETKTVHLADTVWVTNDRPGVQPDRTKSLTLKTIVPCGIMLTDRSFMPKWQQWWRHWYWLKNSAITTRIKTYKTISIVDQDRSCLQTVYKKNKIRLPTTGIWTKYATGKDHTSGKNPIWRYKQ